jgi:hypothetical protein
MLSRSQINSRIQRAAQAHKEERLRSPQIIQRGKAVRHTTGTGSRVAFVAEAEPPASDTVYCWLDADVTDADYNAGATYAADDYCVYNYVRYKSLAGSNTGNTPSSSPTYWEAVKTAVEVRCLMAGTTSLSEAFPWLVKSAEISVAADPAEATGWRSVMTFNLWNWMSIGT